MPIDLTKLSEEEKVEYERDQAELVERRKRDHQSDVDKRIEELKGLGLSEEQGFSGLLRYVRERLLADDGEPAIVLSENGQPKGETVTQVIDGLIECLPKTTEGKLATQLSEQHFQGAEGRKPSNDTKDELTPRQKADEFRRQANIQTHLINT